MFGFGKKAVNRADMENNPLWFQEAVNEVEHMARVSKVIDIKQYLLGQHKVLQRPDFNFKEEKFITSKIVLNVIKTIINSHVSYLIGNPVSLNGNPDVVSLFNHVGKKGNYNKTNYEIVKDLYTYGNAFEYIYVDTFDNKKIKSRIIKNEDAFPIYDENYNYVSFVEHWKDIFTYDDHYTVYYPNRIETYKNSQQIDIKSNTTGALPIHYCSVDKSQYSHFGEPFVNDMIVIIDAIEYLLSKMDDGVTVHSLSPLAVAIGKRVDTRIPKELVGAVLNIGDEGGDFKYATALLDHASIKLLLDNLWAQFYAIACVPSTSMGQSNIANVSETSLRLLYARMDDKAKETIQALQEGMCKRFDCQRKLLALTDRKISDEDYDTLDICFNVNRPVDTYSLMEELAIQRSMNAISVRTIVDKSPYTVDTATEMDRLIEEAASVDKLSRDKQMAKIKEALSNAKTNKDTDND